ncbi:MAG: hypothetical protein MZW92_31470 [Comamonadaceae bacterium]|nr:hypothetical protein [Comamonadaceae bacterium]
MRQAALDPRKKQVLDRHYKESLQAADSLVQTQQVDQLDKATRAKNQIEAGKGKPKGLDTDKTFQDWLSPLLKRVSIMEAASTGGDIPEMLRQRSLIQFSKPEKQLEKPGGNQ